MQKAKQIKGNLKGKKKSKPSGVERIKKELIGLRDPFLIRDWAIKTKKVLEGTLPFSFDKAESAKINLPAHCGNIVIDKCDTAREIVLRERMKMRKGNWCYTTFYEMLDSYLSKCYLNLNIQRLFGSWGIEQTSDFLIKLYSASLQSVSTIHMVNCRASSTFAASRQNSNSIKSMNYHDNVVHEQKCDYVNLDGQHRVVSIMMFICGEIKAKDISGNIVGWKDLSVEQKERILYSLFYVQEYQDVAMDEMEMLFYDANSGNPANDMQRRRSRGYKGGLRISSAIQDLTYEIENDILKKYLECDGVNFVLFNKDALVTAADQEFYLKLFLLKHHVFADRRISNNKKTELDKICYEKNLYSEKDFFQFSSEIKSLIKSVFENTIIDQKCKKLFVNKNLIRRSMIFNCYLFQCTFKNYFSGEVKIRDEGRFLKEFIIDYILSKLYVGSVDSFTGEERGMYDEYGRSLKKDVKENKFFFTLLEDDVSNRDYIGSKQRLFMKVLEENDVLYNWKKLGFGEVFSVLDPRRCFTPKQKLEMHERQKGKCGCGCGKSINFGNTVSYAGHHIKDYGRGNPTEIENGLLVLVECHKIETKRQAHERAVERRGRGSCDAVLDQEEIIEVIENSTNYIEQQGEFINE